MKKLVALVLLVTACSPLWGADRTVNLAFESDANLSPRGKMDRVVFARLRQEGIEPANLCSDAVFLRRVYLDVIGTLPTADEAVQFLTDRSPDEAAGTDRRVVGARRVRGLLGVEVE